MVRQRYQLIPSKNSGIQLDQRHTWLHSTKSDRVTCYLPLMNIPKQKNLRYQLISSRVLLIKESCNQIGQEANLVTLNQNLQSQMVLSFDSYLYAKVKDIDWVFPVVLLIKESCNMIGHEAQVVTFKQKQQSHRCSFMT